MPIIYHKNRFETPLEALQRFRSARQDLAEETLSYAGRLDPMAEGVLLVLVGEEENRDRQKYLGLDKSYEVEVLLGVSTDTGDVLGIVNELKVESGELKDIFEEKEIAEKLKELEGENNFPYPIYSSRTVKGKPLHEWAREGRIQEIEIPTKTSTIYRTKSLGIKEKNSEEILDEVLNDLEQVSGDFRQEEIKKAWQKSLENLDIKFQIVTVTIDCSSGAYMRTVAEELGKKLGKSALAYRIKRTKIGNYTHS